MMAAGVVSALTLTADMILASAPPERAGAASAVSETASELGGALGIALLGSIGAAVYRDEIAPALPAGLSPDARAAAHDTLGGAAAVAGEMPGESGPALLEAARVAFSSGLNLAALAGAFTMTVGAILAVLLLRDVRPAPAAETSEPEVQRVESASASLQALIVIVGIWHTVRPHGAFCASATPGRTAWRSAPCKPSRHCL
jgi:DHA2 family multidrug resistance protein-like MFS transporter